MIKSLVINKDEKNNQDEGSEKKQSKKLYLIIFIFLYSFFALQRIKNSMSYTVEGITVTNQIWIIPLIYIFSIFLSKEKRIYRNRYNDYIIVCISIYLLVMIAGGFNITSIGQYVVAILSFLLPMFLYFITSKLIIKDVQYLLKIMILTSLFYSIFSIVLTNNYAFFISLVGNPVDRSAYYSQYRPNTMFGSSISVSYYLNLSLPLFFYLYYTCRNMIWKNILILTIVSNIAATFVLLSRASVLCVILIIIAVLLFVKKDKNSKKINILLFILLLFSGIYIMKNFDLTRLLIGFDPNSSSVSARLTAGNLGLYIFSKEPLFGSGMGEYFNRIYRYKYRLISVDGFTGLIDPHNMYILVLSETGIMGFILLTILFLLLIKNFSKIKDKELKWTSYISVFAFLFDSMGGSHLFNEISFASVFWIYMGMFNVFILKKKNETLI